MSAKAEPKLIEISAQAHAGGKVTIIKYDLSGDAGNSLSRKWAVPESMSNEEAEAFQLEQAIKLTEAVDSIVNPQVEDLMDQSHVFDEEGNYTG